MQGPTSSPRNREPDSHQGPRGGLQVRFKTKEKNMIHYMVKKWCVEFKNMGGKHYWTTVHLLQMPEFLKDTNEFIKPTV